MFQRAFGKSHVERRQRYREKNHLWFVLTNLEVAGFPSACVSLETPPLPQTERMEFEFSWLSVPF